MRVKRRGAVEKKATVLANLPKGKLRSSLHAFFILQRQFKLLLMSRE
jgi:hypothetical protein